MKNIELLNTCAFDYIKSIQDNSIDLIILDPPYEISRATGFKNGCKLDKYNISMDFGTWDINFKNLNIIIQESYRCLKKGGTLICFYDLWKITLLKQYFDNSKFKQLRFIEWLKTNPVPINSKINYLTNAREIALTGIKHSNPTFNSKYNNGIYKYPIYHNKDRFHPTTKPLDLIIDLINIHSNENDTVLDLFSGSGTTALASVNTGRKFKGCEIDTNFYQLSIKRLGL